MAFIERLLAARFFAAGRDDLERSSGLDLLRELLNSAWVSQEEFDQFDRVRRLRNPIVHFRRPLAVDTIEYRQVKADAHPDELDERDAREILTSVFRVLQRSAL